MVLPEYLVCFDTETTGVDVEKDRVVTAFVGVMDRELNWVEHGSWLINPGVPIPEEASNVHGITTEHAVQNGAEPDTEIQAMARYIERVVVQYNAPLVIYNSPFDLTLLDRELKRNNLPTLDLVGVNVVDPLVFDKATDKYRKGSRKLVDTAAHYGVTVEDNAHDAGADCLMTGGVAWKLLGKATKTLAELHELQVGWKAEQSASFQEYLRRTKDPEAVIDGSWPYKKED